VGGAFANTLARLALTLQDETTGRAEGLLRQSVCSPERDARRGSTSNVFTGTVSTFRRLGFRTVSRQERSRPIMLHD
jgi:hypothetical protein